MKKSPLISEMQVKEMAQEDDITHENLGQRATADPKEEYVLRLYVAGQTQKSIEAFENLKEVAEEHLRGRYKIEVIDLLKNPQLAKGDQILATPTLVRRLPPPIRKIIGDLSNHERVLVGLDIQPRKRP